MKKYMYPKSTKFRKIVVELDPSENYEGATPAMIRLLKNDHEVDCCTWNVIEAGESLENESFTDQEWEWLMSMDSIVKDFIESVGN